MARGLPKGRLLVFFVAVIVVGVIVGLLVANNNSDDPPCNTTIASDLPDKDRSADEAFAIFIAEQEEGPLPLSGWSKTSESADGTVFTSDVGGRWQVTVRNGQVRQYGCRA